MPAMDLAAGNDDCRYRDFYHRRRATIVWMIGERMMDRNTAIELLKLEQQRGDTEAAHSNADGVLCDLLKALGYQDVVDEYEKVDKWFA
jgi:hypothetical protein